jgi:purine nucleosidase/pyrimidine-specific ribonucleoside hydrolase
MDDPLAVTALVRPEILTFAPMRVDVELAGTHTYGMTLSDGRRLDPATLRPRGDYAPRTDAGAPNAEVAVAVDVEKFWDLFLEVLATYP